MPNDDSVRILIVEDNPVNQKVAQGFLNKLGLSTDVVMNGKEALDAISQKDYDLVFMDCQMPIMDGYIATQKIREKEHKDGMHVTIVAMTANAMKGDREKCFDSGMDDYMCKPLKMNLLKDKLNKWLKLGLH